MDNINVIFDEEKKIKKKIIERQKLEAHKIVEFEIKQQILRKEHEEHINKEKFIDDNKNQNYVKEMKLKDLEENKKELEINIKEAKEIIINREKDKDKENNKDKNKDLEKYLYYGMSPEDAIELIKNTIKHIDEEINKIKEEILDEKRRKNLIKLKEKEMNEKHLNFQKKYEKEYMEEYKKSHEIRKLEEIKEQNRQNILEKKRIKKVKEHEKSMDIHKKRFEENNIKIEEKLKKDHEEAAKKLLLNKENREHFEDLRNIAMKKKVGIHLKRQEEIKIRIEKIKEEDESKKEKKSKKKMAEMEKHKKIFDQEKENKLKEKNLELQQKSLKIIEIGKLRQEEINQKAILTMYKIQSFFDKSERKRESIERENMYNNERLQKKRFDVESKNKRIDYLKEIERQRAIENIQESYKKSEIFLDQKNFLSQKKKILSIEYSNKRKDALDKFEKYMAKYREVNVMINILYSK